VVSFSFDDVVPVWLWGQEVGLVADQIYQSVTYILEQCGLSSHKGDTVHL